MTCSVCLVFVFGDFIFVGGVFFVPVSFYKCYWECPWLHWPPSLVSYRMILPNACLLQLLISHTFWLSSPDRAPFKTLFVSFHPSCSLYLVFWEYWKARLWCNYDDHRNSGSFHRCSTHRHRILLAFEILELENSCCLWFQWALVYFAHESSISSQ